MPLAVISQLVLTLSAYRATRDPHVPAPDVAWTDVYASLDPVPNGAVSRRSMKVENERSTLRDHGSYWRNRDEFLPILFEKLAQNAPSAVPEVTQGRGGILEFARAHRYHRGNVKALWKTTAILGLAAYASTIWQPVTRVFEEGFSSGLQDLEQAAGILGMRGGSSAFAALVAAPIVAIGFLHAVVGLSHKRLGSTAYQWLISALTGGIISTVGSTAPERIKESYQEWGTRSLTALGGPTLLALAAFLLTVAETAWLWVLAALAWMVSLGRIWLRYPGPWDLTPWESPPIRRIDRLWQRLCPGWNRPSSYQ